MFVNRQRRVNVPVKPLEDFFERVRQELRFPQNAVTIQFISDAAMARLNQNFRHKRGPTDVLSFPANGGSRPQQIAAKWTAWRNVCAGGWESPEDYEFLLCVGRGGAWRRVGGVFLSRSHLSRTGPRDDRPRAHASGNL